MKLRDYINITELTDMIEAGYINATRHPVRPLTLYNYTPECQYARAWNDTTMKCRGLVVDDESNIVARPFEKFFNYEELEGVGIKVPEGLPFDIYEKMDGSLGILFWYRGQWIICTRGSFTSNQAEHAQVLFNKKYLTQAQFDLDTKKTYLFEIIYPEDSHIVAYGKEDDIYLLAIFDNETGTEENIYNYSDIFKCTKIFKGYDWKNIRSLFDEDNKEGFVVRFSNGFRMKIKFEQYFKIASLKEHLTEKKIFEYISTGKESELLELIKCLPEETQIWVHEIKNNMTSRLYQLLSEAWIYYSNREDLFIGYNEKISKLAADYYSLSGECRPIVFAYANHRTQGQIRDIAWKIVKNEYDI